MLNKKGGKEAYLMALSNLIYLHFKPAKTSPQRIPIQTTHDWEFVTDHGKNAGKKVSCDPGSA